MRFLSLFSGIESASQAWIPLGWQCVGHSEIEPFPCAVLKHHYPETPNLGDVTKITKQQIEEIINPSSLGNDVKTWYCDPQTPEEITMAGQLKKLTKEQAQECVTMYDSGLSLAPIAEYFGVSRQAMWDLLRRRTTLRSQKRCGDDNHFARGGKTADSKAQNVLEYAIRTGVVERKYVCETCGSTGTMKDGRTKIQAHHSDYNKPLDVMWLCQKCHHAWHKKHIAKRKETNTELTGGKIDLVVGGFP